MRPRRLPVSVLEHNVMSVNAIPVDLLPEGKARNYLLNQAWKGEDVEAYVPYQPRVPVKERMWWVFVDGKRCSVVQFERGFNQVKPISDIVER